MKEFFDRKFYEWPGTRAAAIIHGSVHQPHSSVTVFLDLDVPDRAFTFDLVRDEDRVFAESDDRFGRSIPLDEKWNFRRRALGLVLDLQTDRPVGRGGVEDPQYVRSANGMDQAWSVVPRWVPDEAWDRRHESILEHLAMDEDGVRFPLLEQPWLGHVCRLQVKAEHDMGDFFARWGAVRSELRTAGADSLAQLADQVCAEEKLLPVRDQQAWLEENVTFGVFVVPSPEEVELYQMLGERSPLLWPAKRLFEWFEENR